ncbi:MAG: hypothetical protein H3C27_12195 [Opitutaceae bacterium]|nr:hypothetical protein [Opitutaceae bacterium]
MKPIRLSRSHRLVTATVALLLASALPATAAANSSTLKFSDPAQPGTLRIAIQSGDISVKGTDGDAVTVQTDLPAGEAPVRKDGLRVLSESATFNFTEKDNVITLDTGGNRMLGMGDDAEFALTVPRQTRVIISNGFGGEIELSDLAGDIEVKSLNGEITLRNISGGALVETINGEIEAHIVAVQDGKPLSFTSMNGEIAIHVPAETHANVRLRTQNGAILTDFDEQTLVTTTENLLGPRSARTSVYFAEDSDIKVVMREAIRAGAEAAREAAEAMREAAQAAREAAEEARAGQSGPVPPIPPVPPVPPMTGGKLVSGTLNGGGTEIYAAAMNGDVTLRRAR